VILTFRFGSVFSDIQHLLSRTYC